MWAEELREWKFVEAGKWQLGCHKQKEIGYTRIRRERFFSASDDYPY
jgi:hypothetical protein